MYATEFGHPAVIDSGAVSQQQLFEVEQHMQAGIEEHKCYVSEISNAPQLLLLLLQIS